MLSAILQFFVGLLAKLMQTDAVIEKNDEVEGKADALSEDEYDGLYGTAPPPPDGMHDRG